MRNSEWGIAPEDAAFHTPHSEFESLTHFTYVIPPSAPPLHSGGQGVSEAKNLGRRSEMLHYVQHDTA